MANGDNLLLGAEVVLEDSKTIESEVLKKIDTIQKKIDKDPLEMKISVGEMKGIATSLTKVRNALSKEADKISKEISSMGAVSGLSPDQQAYYSQLVEKQKQLNALSDSLLTTQSKIRAEASQLNGEANSISKGIAKAASEAEKLEAKFMGISDAQKASIASYDISAIKGATKEHIEGMRNYASYLQLQTKEMSDEWNQFGYIIQRINALIGDTAKESKELADKTKGLSSGYIDRDEALDGVAIIDEINKETEESIRLEKEHRETTKQRTAEVTRLHKLYANLTSEQRRQVRDGSIDLKSLTSPQLVGAANVAKKYQSIFSEITDEYKTQEGVLAKITVLSNERTEKAKIRAKYTDKYIAGLSEATTKERELKAAVIDKVAGATEDNARAESYKAQANALRKLNKDIEEEARLEKEAEDVSKRRVALAEQLRKLYANLTSEQRRQVRSGNIGNISADTEGVLKRMIKYSKEYATHVGLSNKEVKAQEALVQSLNSKLAKVAKEAKLASAEYQALSKVVKKGAASLIPEDTTLSNDVLKERLAMSELIASSLRTHTKEYAKHLAYQQSIKEALKYQSAEAIKALESQAKTMDESSIDARNAKIAVYEKLLKQVNDTTEEGIKKQKEYVAVVNRLTTANAKAKSREADLEKEKAATQKVTDEKNRQLKIEENIKAILSGTATTENIINEAIRERVKLQGTLNIGSEAYLQNEREIDQLTEKLPANIRKSTEAYSNQANVVQQMKGMVDDYIGLYAIFRGMDSIVQTTADFEMQKVALTALSGSMIDTEKIWSQIAAQSVKSPFALKDLVTYTKQLSAYRIENDKLFDTTKQLADISAGLGVEMGRIILAYGQVKAATVLRGTELRQFTEAGFDLLPALAQKFTELNGTVVTTAEVFDLISERAVPFEMVAEVFDDMTAAGGRFYNMQEIQSDTTRGLLINIQDQADLTKVALGEMNEGLIKAFLSGSKGALEFAANNAGLVNSILSVVGAGAAYQLTLGVQDEIMRRYNSSVKADIALQKLQKQGISELTAKRLQSNVATKISTASQKKLTIEELKAIAVQEGLTESQTKYFIAANASATANTFLGKSLAKLKAAFATNPVTAWAAALGAVVGIISTLIGKSRQQREEMSKIRAEYVKLAQERKSLSDVATNVDLGVDEQLKALDEYFEKLHSQGVDLKLNIDKDATAQDIADAIALGEATSKGLRLISTTEENQTKKWVENYNDSYSNAVSFVDKATVAISNLKSTFEDAGIDTSPFDLVIEELNNIDTSKSLRDVDKLSAKLKELESFFGANGKAIKSYENKVGALWERSTPLENAADDFTDMFLILSDRLPYKLFGENFEANTEAYLNSMLNKIESIPDKAKPFVLKAKIDEQFPALAEDMYEIASKILGVPITIFTNTGDAKSDLKEWQKGFNAELASTMQDFEVKADTGTTQKMVDFVKQFNVENLKAIGQYLDNEEGLLKYIASQSGDNIALWADQVDQSYLGNLSEYEKEQAKTALSMIDHLDIYNDGIYDTVAANKKLNSSMIQALKAFNIKDIKTTPAEQVEALKKALTEAQAILDQIDAGTPAYLFPDFDEEKMRGLVEIYPQLISYLTSYNEADKGGANEADKAVSLLKEELSLLADVNKAYADNLKVMSSDAAAKAVKDLYADVFGDLENFKGLKPTDVIDVAGLNSQYEKAKTIINKLLGEGTAKANKVILEFDKATTQNSAKEAMAIIKAEIDKLNKDIAKQQEASNFMDKILGLTSGNMELATSITMSVYGNTGEELEKAMVEQVRKAFSGGGVSSAVAKGVEDAIDGTDVDYVALQGLIEQLPEDMRSSAEKIVKEGMSANAKIVEDLYKNLSKTKTYEDKRTDILRAGIKQRREIEESNLKDSEKEYLKGLSNDSESKQLQQLEFADFKESDTYIQMFDRLETTSTATLDIMKRKLEGMREAWKDGLEPTQLKELQSRLNEISDELDTRGNPFTVLKESITEYRAELAKANLAQREAALLEAQSAEGEKKDTVDIMGDSLALSELELLEARESGDQLRIAAAEALYRLNLANYNEANKEYIAAKEITETRQKDVKTLTTLDGKIIKLRKSTRALKQDLVTSMVDFASASNDALQAGVFGNLSDEVEGVVDSVVSAGMEIAQVTTSTIGAIQDTMEGAVWGMKAAAETGKEAISSVEKASVILAVISAALQIATKIADAIGGAKDAQADADIEKAQMEVDRLNNSIDDLGDKADESFGKAKIGAMKMQDELREQQALAYDAMILAEQSRKEPDEAQIAEWQRAGDLLRKEIKDTGEYFEAYMGTSQTEAFKTLKDAWFELWKDVDSTAIDRMNNMKNAWREMLQNMIMEQMAMKIIQAQMEPLFKKIEQTITNQDGVVTDEQIEGWLAEGDAKIEALFPQLELIGQWMEKMGIRTTEVSDSSDGSLAQGVASATSEEVTTLSGYMSSVLQYQILSYAILDRWEKTGYGGVTIAGTDSKAQDGTFHLAAISTNTLNAANTLAEIREILDGVTTPIGSDKGISINVDVVG